MSTSSQDPSASKLESPANARNAFSAILAQRSARFEALNLVSLPTWIFDIDHSRVHWANQAALVIWDAQSLQELCERDMAIDMSDSVRRRLKQYQADFVSQKAVFNEQWTLYPGGKPVPLKARFSGIELEDGRMAMWCEGHLMSVEFDTPEHRRSVEALLHTEIMISLYDMDGQVLYRNPAARESVSRLDERLQDRMGDPEAYAHFMDSLQATESATTTLQLSTIRGSRWLEISARRCRDAVTGLDAMLVSEADVSAIKRTEAKANFLASHDSLTGLPNRSTVLQHFAQTVDHIRTTGQQAALIYLDLDHFKDINDTLGHAAGDELLVQMAKRMRSSTRSSDLVARLGGDEFLILIVSHDIQQEVDLVRGRLLHAVAQPLWLRGTEVQVTPSLGVSMYPTDGTDFDTLMRNADLAMYTAKTRGRNGMAYFDPAMADAARARTTLESELRHALERNEFEVHYQPRVNLITGNISGAEALVRWRHPVHGLLAPDRFIGLCEETGLIVRLGAHVFQQAALQQVAWASSGTDLQVGVNLSARQFRDPELLATIAQALTQAHCTASRMQLEITESLLIGSEARPLEILCELERMGLSIALDDFGTGYSNLAYLHRFPIHTLKIDKSFIQGDSANLPLAGLIVEMCRVMHLQIVAEGVETEPQLQWVTDKGIESYQGYWFAKPLSVQDFNRLLAQQATHGHWPRPSALN